MISVIVPTRNRRAYILQLLRYFAYQTYPLNDMELIIVDDGEEPIEDLLLGSGLYHRAKKSQSRLFYHHLDQPITIGEKRNLLNDMARGEIIVAMDDDDWYSTYYVSEQVQALKRSNKLICGSSRMNCYFTDLKAIVQLGPYAPTHTTNGFMAYKRSYLDNHRYSDEATSGEEPYFTNNFTEPMIQIKNGVRLFLCISHSSNSYDRKQLLNIYGLQYENGKPGVVVTEKYRELERRGKAQVKPTRLKLKDIVKIKEDRAFYKNMGQD